MPNAFSLKHSRVVGNGKTAQHLKSVVVFCGCRASYRRQVHTAVTQPVAGCVSCRLDVVGVTYKDVAAAIQTKRTRQLQRLIYVVDDLRVSSKVVNRCFLQLVEVVGCCQVYR